LNVLSGADAWWLPVGRMTLFFLDSSDNEITNATRNTVDPVTYGSVGDIAHPWSNYTLVATSPAGTAKVKVEFASAMPRYNGGSVWFENASLTAPIAPPVIANVYPDGTKLMQSTNKLSFTASSGVTIAAAGVHLVLDGVDVSGSLVITGAGTTSVSASYTGLTLNQTHTAVITVTDAANLNAISTVNFDTYNAPLFSWEAEDYDYSSGQFINSPTPSGSAAAGSYFGLVGTEGVDFHDRAGNGNHVYRASDTMATDASGDQPRTGATPDFSVGWFDGAGFPAAETMGIAAYDAGEWVNYTRNFPAGTYNIIGRVANGNGGTATIPLSKVVSGWGTSSQTTTELGVFQFPANGWGSYAYVPLTDKNGNRIAVTLSGINIESDRRLRWQYELLHVGRGGHGTADHHQRVSGWQHPGPRHQPAHLHREQRLPFNRPIKRDRHLEWRHQQQPCVQRLHQQLACQCAADAQRHELHRRHQRNRQCGQLAFDHPLFRHV
jgi:hypothetical protein